MTTFLLWSFCFVESRSSSVRSPRSSAVASGVPTLHVWALPLLQGTICFDSKIGENTDCHNFPVLSTVGLDANAGFKSSNSTPAWLKLCCNRRRVLHFALNALVPNCAFQTQTKCRPTAHQILRWDTFLPSLESLFVGHCVERWWLFQNCILV